MMAQSRDDEARRLFSGLLGAGTPGPVAARARFDLAHERREVVAEEMGGDEVQLQEVGVFVDRSVNWTVRDTSPEVGEPTKSATGGLSWPTPTARSWSSTTPS